MDLNRLAEGIRHADARALARAISLVENETPEGRALIGMLHSASTGACVIGVTGPPGAGKSTLVDQLVTHLRTLQRTVGVLAIDPTSAFTGGAILGDRVRMSAHAADAGVFIRSMATRGQLGGLARAAGDAAIILAAAGTDVILIETVGVGQDEIDVAETADVALVVLVPGTGDDVQAIKAGIMEIADVFIVNKADREGADRMAQSIEMNLSLQSYGEHEWRPPVLKTVAVNGQGVADVWAAIERFRASGTGDRADRRRRGQAARLRALVARRFLSHAEGALPAGTFDAMVDDLIEGRIDIYSAAEQLVQRGLAAR
jgi:LAO/AO transport system kinase